MNIVVITQMYSQPDDSGDNKPTKTVNYFVKEWQQTGNQVIVFHCSSKFPLAYYYAPHFLTDAIVGKTSNIIPPVESRRRLQRIENGVKVYRIPLLKMFPGQGYSEKVLQGCYKEIVSILSSEGFEPDLVMGHFANPSLALVCKLSQHYDAMSSIVFHHDCTAKNIAKYKMSEHLKMVGAVGARSLSEAKEISALLSLDSEPFVCASGAPNDAVEAAARTCIKQDYIGRVKHIYVGSLIARKHLDSTIIAFAKQYKDSGIDATLEVVGGGVEEEKLKNLASNLGVDNMIRFSGRIDRNEVFQKMREANVFTLISDDEVYGMVYIEAMLQGCLVVASKNGGFDGIIIDGYNGFLCNPGDAEMLQTIYNRIDKMPAAERNKIGQNAIDTALHYSEREVASRYLSEVIRQNNKRKESCKK